MPQKIKPGYVSLEGSSAAGEILASDGSNAYWSNTITGNLTITETITSGNISITTDADVNGSLSIQGILNIDSNYVERVSAITISTNTLTIDLSSASVFTANLDANIDTITLSNYPSTTNLVSFVLIFTADGTERSITWPASFRWPANTAPTVTSETDKKDIFAFFTTDGGTNWQSLIVGQEL